LNGREQFDIKIKKKEVQEREEVGQRRCDVRLTETIKMNNDFWSEDL
jgi:hypothetical protein